MNDRNKLVLGFVLLVVLLGLALVVLLTGPKCELLDEPPGEEPCMKPSQDFKDLVIFSGYLKYDLARSNGTKYLPISLKSMTVDRPLPGSQHNRVVILNNDCAKLTFIIDLLEDERQTARIVVESKHNHDALPQVGHNECWIDFPRIDLFQGSHYKCDRLKEYSCKKPIESNEEVVATLVLNKFELEIDGIQNIIKENRFSSPALECL